jgi:ABC-2 type transport system ATP-binding protein
MHAIEISKLDKRYDNGLKALTNINLKVKKGEIFALLGPNGAGKSSLINIICGIAKKNNGKVNILGFDNISQYKQARSLIGLVPQEIATDSFEKVIDTLKFSRGLFNKKKSITYLDKILRDLSLFEKKNQQIRTLSGGMKRRVMIAKALSHEPKILFLDEPTAGVDVELRKNLWRNLNDLKKNGVTIFLTTHYIEEAEQLADRVGVIHEGKIIVVEKTSKLLEKLGKKTLKISIKKKTESLKFVIKKYSLKKSESNYLLNYDINDKNIVSNFFKDLNKNQIEFEDLEIKKSSLEEVFLNLIDK